VPIAAYEASLRHSGPARRPPACIATNPISTRLSVSPAWPTLGRSESIDARAGLEMTMNVYAHVSLEDKQAAFEKLNALFEEA
jgi:hypothetical protein